MKLSVSAFQASCSASAQKILQRQTHNYGATSSSITPLQQATTSSQSTPPRRPNPVFKVEEVEGGCSSPSPPPPGVSTVSRRSARSGQQPSSSSKSAMVDSTGLNTVAAAGTPAGDSSVEEGGASGGSSRSASQEDRSALSSALPSLGTSREDEQHSDISEHSSSATGTRKPGITRSKSQSQRQWARVRNVMALYSRLRHIKRTKSNQRWMKLRTTVQLSGAITTIQKKPTLKREDSFLKRFSTRQVPEQQETLDHGDDSEGGNGSNGGLMSTCAAKARRRKKIAQEKRSVVNPDENFYFYWLMLLTICVLYNLWTLIVRQSFPELQSNIQATWIACDAFTDIIFLLDIVVQFRTGYLEQGLMVYNSKKLASHYMQSRAFLLDVSSLFPLDLLQFNLGINPILRFPRFLKVYRIYDYYYMVESRTVYPNLWRVINLVHILLILAHWFGCFYFLLSEAEGFQGEWVYPYRPGDYATLTRKYLGSLYWSTLTLTTIGDLPTPETNADAHGGSSSSTSSRNQGGGPHNSPPAQPRRGLKSRLLQFNSNNGYIFTIVSYLIGVFIFATIVGQVGNVITNRNANRLEFERLLDGAKTYMRHHKVPGDMKRRVLRWYDYSWSRGRIQGGGDINTALGLLPDKLKTELALHVNLSVLKKVTIFQECQPEFLHDLVLKMKAYIFTPGDLICRKGEVAREMFIIADGILEVISETGRVLTTMKAGDFFGEIGILNLDGLNKRTADVRSVGYSELFSLSREDVLAAMKDYPEAQEILQSLGRKRLMEARNVNRGGSNKPTASRRRVSGVEHAGDSSDSAGKRIVDKIRCDVKGLTSVLRKSRRSNSHSSKEDSMELQPLTSHAGENQHHSKPPRIKKLLLRSINVESSTSHDSTGSGSGRMLRRMGRVHSDEEHESHVAQPPPPAPSTTEVIGAGLPLLQRLLLLKAKEDREQKEREDQASQQPNRVTSPPTVTQIATTSASVTTTAAPTEVIGAGLPLMARLRMLKKKEDDTGKTKSKTPSPLPTSPPSKPTSPPVTATSPPVMAISPPHTTTSSPAVAISPPATATSPPATAISPPLTVTSPPSTVASPPSSTTSPTPIITKSAENEISETSSNEERKKSSEPLKLTSKPVSETSKEPKKTAWPNLIRKKISPKTETKEEVSKEDTSSKEENVEKCVSPPVLQATSSPVKSPINAIKSPIIVTTPPLNSPTTTCSPVAIMSPPSPLSPSQISPPITSPPAEAQISPTSVSSPPPAPSLRPKPNLLRIQQDSKFYQSVDDLSPEYSGLPFVKKLKILNERLKLKELEECVTNSPVRSSSLDSGNNYLQSDSVPISRSRSETCDIDYVQRCRNISKDLSDFAAKLNQESIDSTTDIANLRSESPESPGSNETLERRNLKSILKKLSSSNSDEKSVDLASPVQIAKSKIEFRKLLRAPTVEGYAARHSKFSKSVTFNRETLSPPGGPEVVTETPRMNCSADDVPRSKLTMILPNMLLPAHAQELRREEEFFSDMMTGMKSVLQNHLDEIQCKFQKRFQSLELEVRRRDEIIAQLQARIQELEGKAPITNNCTEVEELAEQSRVLSRGGSEDGDISDQEEEENSDQPFMRGDSVDTVVTPTGSPPELLDSSSDEDCEMLRARLEGQDSWEDDDEITRRGILESSASWEEPGEGECQELRDLPPTLSPENVWHHVSLDVASSSSSSTSSSPLSSPADHNTDWEVQMLAAELDRKEQREKLEGELAELTGKSKLSKSELDILDQVLLESEKEGRHKVKNLSFDDDHIPTRKSRRKRTISESGGGRSVENLLIRGDNLRSSLLRNRIHGRRKTEEDSSIKSGIVSWLSKRSNQQQQIGKQVLNARSLEEPTTSIDTPTSRSSSIGHLPPSRVGSLFTFSRLRLSTLSHSIRGFTRPAATTLPSTSGDPEKAVATITQSAPPSGQS